MKSKYLIAIISGIIAACALGGYFFWKSGSTPGDYDAFAQCIAASGTKFYGAFWCPHCQDQKKEFGNSEKYLPYVECSSPDGKSQLAVCTSAGIQGYPTWVFPDGTRQEGDMTLQQLAQKTGCQLPQQ